MNVRATTAVLLLACLASAGCGTVANLCTAGPRRAAASPSVASSTTSRTFRNRPAGTPTSRRTARDNYPRTALTLLCAVDLPFSFVGDVITWPYTASFTYVNQPAPFAPIQILPPLLPAAAPAEAPPEMRPQPLPPPLPVQPKKMP